MDFTHEPVQLDAIVEVFATVPPGTVVDATVGGGGHAAALLERHAHLAVLGIDRDADAREAANARLAPFGARATVVAGRFDRIAELVAEHDVAPISGALFDLGVSSPQFDRPERGFSYHHDGPLDMRMDRSEHPTAADVVNDYDEAALRDVLRRYGDERFASRIAAAIVAHRPLTSTTQLADVVAAATPAPARRRGGHPARRTFQALRIEVNRELDVIGPALAQAITITAAGGRVAVLSYHSGEDRIVKELFRKAAGDCDCPPGLPCGCGAADAATVRPVRVKRTTDPSDPNRRARSARLRVVERIESLLEQR